MNVMLQKSATVKPIHPWLRKIAVAAVPGPTTSLLEQVVADLLRHFGLQGHLVQTTPDSRTDVLLTTAPFGKPLGWRDALVFNARRRFNLSHSPSLYTLLHVTPEEFQRLLDHFQAALTKEPLDPADYAFPGLAPRAPPIG